ncbi:MAG TPA: S46 family peptidase, partial [Verrucomicrobiae bacterium]|nr:S46 family peptidase [Verrucomicrobiae bacterium]
MKRILLLLVCAGFAMTARGDEGMWLFNEPPRELLRQRYQFDATDAWLNRLQKSSIRFNSGGSGSFISRDGLLISNHHVGADALQKLSAQKKDFLRDGFYARTPAEEIRCLDLELNVLESVEDVTARVDAAIPADAGPDEAFVARRKIIAEIEKESHDKTGLRSDVVTLWEGGAYHLYRYKRYTDVRLVFAPEQQMAFYGGDPDNFEFPRYDLDICIFRAYENGQPAHIEDYLHVSKEGPKDGELVFVSGNPGGTDRNLTVAELDELRDSAVPLRLDELKWQEVLLDSWSARNKENARRAKQFLFGVKNSRKAFDGRLGGLLDPQLMGAKAATESEFKERLANKPEFAGALAAYDKIAAASKILGETYVKYNLFENGMGFKCDSFQIARTLLRAGEERPKPNGERLREFFDSSRPSLELSLFSAKPVYPDLEILSLTESLTYMACKIGPGDPLVQKILGGQTPQERATQLINGTKVRDVAFRKQLYEGGAAAVDAAQDPMIEFARMVDPEARAVRKIVEDQ